MELLRTINLDSLSPEKRQTLTLRQAARAVLFDDENNIALLHVQKGGYYKLPGGGVDEGEDFITALKRECVEETGCTIKVGAEIGMVIEYRGKFNLKQESYCYIAHVIGTKGTPDFTEHERSAEFKLIWVPLDEAIRLVSEANTEDYQGQFIAPRDLVILREAKKLFTQKQTKNE